MVTKVRPSQEMGPLDTMARKGIFELMHGPLSQRGLLAAMGPVIRKMHTCIVHTYLAAIEASADRQRHLWTFSSSVTDRGRTGCRQVYCRQVRFPLMSNGGPHNLEAGPSGF